MTDEASDAATAEAALARLARSTFRARFRLTATDVQYARAKGRETIDRHAHELLGARLGPAHPANDGKQTPMRGHPVFIAQHATATCCRGCLATWHHVPQGRELTPVELDRACALVLAWIEAQLRANPQAMGPAVTAAVTARA